ncbi:YtoQ family protein [Rubritalea tangerina]|uniref:YtoQ family protein n=1 Tax=Rubritalea tangerina TaxID=430798 RepID=A0ABW4ZCG4_9BACT
MMHWNVYLAGEIHTNWREELKEAADREGLAVRFFSPVTDHAASDACGGHILGAEEQPFWHDRKGAGVNAIRTRPMIEKADVVVVKFGDKYRQWNAAYDAGMASALGKPLIIVHPEEYQHALKEIDAAACAVASEVSQVVEILRYVTRGELV